MSDIKCINLGYVVPKDKADEVQELFRTHAAWMQEFYSDSISLIGFWSKLIVIWFLTAPTI